MKDGLLLLTTGITILHTIAIVYNGLHAVLCSSYVVAVHDVSAYIQ